jgi:hypothetical protein
MPLHAETLTSQIVEKSGFTVVRPRTNPDDAPDRDKESLTAWRRFCFGLEIPKSCALWFAEVYSSLLFQSSRSPLL